MVSARFVTGILVICGLAVMGFTRLKPVNTWWLVIRGVIGATSVYFFYRGIMMWGSARERSSTTRIRFSRRSSRP